jgi:MFS family permease
MMIIFMLLSGIAGSTALSNVAGTIADLFGDADNTSQPLGLFVVSANSGSSIGSVIGEWIIESPRLGLNWVFWIKYVFLSHIQCREGEKMALKFIAY